MIEYFGDPQLLIRGAIAGGAGSFLRESALLYSQLEKQQTRRVLLFAFLPLWVSCGAILGAVAGPSSGLTPIYLLLIGASWRKIITDGKFGLKIVLGVLNQIDTSEEKNGDKQSPGATEPDAETTDGNGDKL